MWLRVSLLVWFSAVSGQMVGWRSQGQTKPHALPYGLPPRMSRVGPAVAAQSLGNT